MRGGYKPTRYGDGEGWCIVHEEWRMGFLKSKAEERFVGLSPRVELRPC